MTLLECLEAGRDNAKSLEYLSQETGFSKRAVRIEINRINTAGEEIICTDHSGNGYYIAANIEEAQAYRSYNKSYWLSGIEKDKGILRCMERKFSGQMMLTEG